MELNEYQAKALVTLSVKSDILNIHHACLGLQTEAAEILDHIKKTVFYDADTTGIELAKLDLPHLSEELGDVMWYIAVAAFYLNKTTPLGQLMGLIGAPLFTCTEEVQQYADDHPELSSWFKGLPCNEDEKTLCLCKSLFGQTGGLDGQLIGMMPSQYKEFDEGLEMQLLGGIGNILLSTAKLATRLGLDLGTICENNIKKLSERYKGEFNVAAAKNRDVLAEKLAMETA